MSLPAFAQVSDLRLRGVRIVGADDEARARAVLDDVSALIRNVAGEDWLDSSGEAIDPLTPPIVIAIACQAARRAYENPSNLRQSAIEGYSETAASDPPGGLGLTDEEKQQIRAAAGTSTGGIWALPTTRGPTLETARGWGDPIMVETDGPGGGEPIAYLDPSDVPPL